jgi:hypothetical protein
MRGRGRGVLKEGRDPRIYKGRGLRERGTYEGVKIWWEWGREGIHVRGVS